MTGTGTGVGKTVVAAGLTAALGGSYWKPVQCGLDGPADAQTVALLSGIPAERIVPELWRFHAPLSPHRAAELDGVAITPDLLTPPRVDGPLIIEGAGGLLVPLTRELLFADVFARWAIPVILVASTALGTINHTLLSIEAIRNRSIPFAGLVFCGDGGDDSMRTIEDFSGAAVLGRLPVLAPLDQTTLAAAFREHISLEALMPATA